MSNNESAWGGVLLTHAQVTSTLYSSNGELLSAVRHSYITTVEASCGNACARRSAGKEYKVEQLDAQMQALTKIEVKYGWQASPWGEDNPAYGIYAPVAVLQYANAATASNYKAYRLEYDPTGLARAQGIYGQATHISEYDSRLPDAVISNVVISDAGTEKQELGNLPIRASQTQLLRNPSNNVIRVVARRVNAPELAKYLPIFEQNDHRNRLFEVRYFYDGKGVGDLGRGNLTLSQQVAFYDGQERSIDTQMEYNALGSRVRARQYRDYGTPGVVPDPKGGRPQSVVTATFDPVYGTYLTNLTNALGQSSQFYYYGINEIEDPRPKNQDISEKDLALSTGNLALGNQPYGLLQAVQGPNGEAQRTFYAYDAFGRSKKIASPGDSLAYPTLEMRYFDGIDEPRLKDGLMMVESRIRGVAGVAWEADGATASWGRVIYDGLGRILQTQGPGVDEVNGKNVDKTVIATAKYDALGRVIAQRMPTFGVGNELGKAESETAPAERQAVYDMLGRVVRLVSPDTASGAVFYGDSPTLYLPGQSQTPDNVVWQGGSTAMQVDPNGNFRFAVFDTYGRLIRSEVPDSDLGSTALVSTSKQLNSENFTFSPQQSIDGDAVKSSGVCVDSQAPAALQRNAVFQPTSGRTALLRDDLDRGLKLDFKVEQVNKAQAQFSLVGKNTQDRDMQLSVVVNEGRIFAQVTEQGKVMATYPLIGNARANTWYTLLIRLKDGQVQKVNDGTYSQGAGYSYAQIDVWERHSQSQHGGQFVEMKNAATTTYRFQHTLNCGNSWLANYDEFGYTTTRYVYNARNQLVNTIDAEGNGKPNQFDAFGRRGNMTFGGWERYGYDAAGNQMSYKASNGHSITYTYDLLNRVLRKWDVTTDSEYARYCYDSTCDGKAVPNGIGKRIEMRNAVDTTTWAFDVRGRLSQERKTIDGVGPFETSMSYDSANRLMQLVYPSGEKLSQGYDHAGRAVSLNGSQPYVTDIDYNEWGKLDAIDYANGLTADYAYYGLDLPATPGSFGRVAELKIENEKLKIENLAQGSQLIAQSLSAQGLSAQGSSLLDLKYHYDAGGRTTQVEDGANEGQSEYFSYDHLNRLVSAWTSNSGAGQFAERYAYDTLGRMSNRVLTAQGRVQSEKCKVESSGCNAPMVSVQTNYSYDDKRNPRRVTTVSNENVQSQEPRAKNQDISGKDLAPSTGNLILETQNGLRYNANGALIGRYENGRWLKYDYNNDNRIVAITDEQSKRSVTYDYDALGKRVRQRNADGSSLLTIGSHYQVTLHGSDSHQVLKGNLALGKAASASSSQIERAPTRANDDNTADASPTAFVSEAEAAPWWQIDLGEVRAIGLVRVWNALGCDTACTQNSHVLVSDTPITTPSMTAQSQGTRYALSANGGWAETLINRSGRYVRVVKDGGGQFTRLMLNEVQVFAPEATYTPSNLAAGKVSSASSMNCDPSGCLPAGYANDGKLGNDLPFASGSQAQPWWQVDLGEVKPVSGLRLWQHLGADGSCAPYCLRDLVIIASQTPISASLSLSEALTRRDGSVTRLPSPTPKEDGSPTPKDGSPTRLYVEIPITTTARYVRVWASDAAMGYLVLREVQVLGNPVPMVDAKSYYYLAGRRMALRDAEGVKWLHGAPQGFAALMTDAGGRVAATQRYTPLGAVRMASNGYGQSYSLTQTPLKAGKVAPNPSRTADDGPPPDCSDCYPNTDPDGNVTWTPRPGDGGSSGGGSSGGGSSGGGSSGGGSSGGGSSGGGSSGGGSSGGGSSGGGSSGSGVDNYEPPPYVEAPASSYPYESYTQSYSDPVYESYQSQDTASEVVQSGGAGSCHLCKPADNGIPFPIPIPGNIIFEPAPEKTPIFQDPRSPKGPDIFGDPPPEKEPRIIEDPAPSPVPHKLDGDSCSFGGSGCEGQAPINIFTTELQATPEPTVSPEPAITPTPTIAPQPNTPEMTPVATQIVSGDITIVDGDFIGRGRSTIIGDVNVDGDFIGRNKIDTGDNSSNITSPNDVRVPDDGLILLGNLTIVNGNFIGGDKLNDINDIPEDNPRLTTVENTITGHVNVIQTYGGAIILGDLTVQGDFIGRDRIIINHFYQIP